MENTAVNWDSIGTFERFPKVNDLLKDLNKSLTLKFLDEGKVIPADVLNASMKQKGIKGMKGKDTIVFIVDNKGTKNELWVGATSYTNLQEIKRIREANKNALVGATFKITRISADDPNKPSFSFVKA